MAAVIRASRFTVSLRTTSQRASMVPRPTQPRFAVQRSVAVRSASDDVTETQVDADKLVRDLQAKYDAIENKPQFFLSCGGALVGLWFASIILGAVDRVPMIPKAFELVGLSYSAWFTWRYLLFKSSREELIQDVEDLKNKITGSE